MTALKETNSLRSYHKLILAKLSAAYIEGQDSLGCDGSHITREIQCNTRIEEGSAGIESG